MSSPLIPQGIDDLFDREDERAWLLKKLCKRPSTVIVLVGPKSAGKSTLLKYLLVKYPELVGMRHAAVYIDGRTQKIASPADLVAAVKKSGITALRQLQLSADSVSLWDAFTNFPISFELTAAPALGVKLTTGAPSTGEESPINQVLGLLTALLSKQTTGEASDLPVIVVDEVNAIAEWRASDDGSDLQSLLRFFVNVSAPMLIKLWRVLCLSGRCMCRFSLPSLFDLTSTFLYLSSQVTKVESASRSMHVILATSDYNFVSWLSQSEHDSGDEAEGGGRGAVRLLAFGPGPAAGKSLSHACPHPL